MHSCVLNVEVGRCIQSSKGNAVLCWKHPHAFARLAKMYYEGLATLVDSTSKACAQHTRFNETDHRHRPKNRSNIIKNKSLKSSPRRIPGLRESASGLRKLSEGLWESHKNSKVLRLKWMQVMNSWLWMIVVRLAICFLVSVEVFRADLWIVALEFLFSSGVKKRLPLRATRCAVEKWLPHNSSESIGPALVSSFLQQSSGAGFRPLLRFQWLHALKSWQGITASEISKAYFV